MALKDAKSHFESGLKAFKDGQYDAALDAFNRAICIGGKRVVFLDSRAAVYEKLGDVKKALEDAKTCVTVDPKSAKGYLRSYKLFASIGRYSSAITMLEHGIGLSPSEKRPALTAALHELQQKAEETGRKLDPVAVLPPEVWSEVLRHGVQRNPDFAIRPALVSRGWRAATMCTTSAWSRLDLQNAAVMVPKTRAWVQRSGGRIEEVSLRTSNTSVGEKVVTELMDCIETVKILSVTSGNNGLWINLCRVWQQKLVSVEHLRLIMTQDLLRSSRIQPDSRLDFGLLAEDSSSLATLTLSGFMLPVDARHAKGFKSSQLAKLERLDLSGIEALQIRNSRFWSPDYNDTASDRLHAVLSKAIALETLLLENLFIMPEDTAFGAPIDDVEASADYAAVSSHRITTFREGGSRGRSLLNLSLPLLQHVALDHAATGMYERQLDHYNADYSKIRTFCFKRVVSDESEVNGLLPRMTSLEIIRFEKGVSDEVVEYLAGHPREFPHLHSLFIARSDVRSSPLLRLVKGRLPASLPSTQPAIPELPPKRIFAATKSIASAVRSTSPLTGQGKKSDLPLNPNEATESMIQEIDVRRITTLVLDRCPNIEKVAEEWLRKNVGQFTCIYPPPPTQGYRDRFQ